ncbi:DUF7149 domain-containing protein [Staphylococcus equorum]|uniref:DUF7149 domain-containing protein n=1 Tax=Staphylococcus equorum TaxID=246432 RepID=UPI002554822B|nr:TaqI-like C-terminal specificity domain-containing protein [Staphylococcus equorum]MDK9850237.1 TaqI-like C-terminal specificity domain-containing protein [Staphylococcus equorum]
MDFYNVNDYLSSSLKRNTSGTDEYLTFKESLSRLVKDTNVNESEEFNKNILSEFLKVNLINNYAINTKGRTDLAIYNTNDYYSDVGAIIEVKRSSNKAEMMSIDRINVKSLQELILYYLRERVTYNNLKLKRLIITDIDNWFVFDATDFEKHVYNNKKLIKYYKQFIEGQLSGISTDFFYKEIAKPFIDEELQYSKIPCLHFTLSEYTRFLEEKNYSRKLDSLHLIFTPFFLLKKPIPRNKKNIDKNFYDELLYILGLREVKKKEKKIIARLDSKDRQAGSLIENIISEINTSNKLDNVDFIYRYGKTKDEQLFNIALQLVITWINRVLFIKLLEGFLKDINNNKENKSFFNKNNIENTYDLHSLFFEVLAIPSKERATHIKQSFKSVPYLNSSLFELTKLEQEVFSINSLQNIQMQVYNKTKLRYKDSGPVRFTDYLMDFFGYYSFSDKKMGSDHSQIINPAILGLVFEKLNGYKDGSYYTPANITSLMTNDTIELAVIDKFNEKKGLECQSLIDVYNSIDNIPEANSIIESIKICDPAVGSGHFLISALNKLISIKHELGILVDSNNKRIKDYIFKISDDDLIILDNDGEFQYNPDSIESQRLQETMFKEKKNIIEKCLFGVDINPNSVNICRLRLWIELLKSSYYDPKKSGVDFVSLPNIDINIKVGDSLLSAYPVDSNVGDFTKGAKFKVEEYKALQTQYINASSKEEKRNLDKALIKIKASFKNVIKSERNLQIKKNKVNEKIYHLDKQLTLFQLESKASVNKERKALRKDLKKIETDLALIEKRKNIENVFEWRFEVPEILDNEAKFIGFDIIIGNPPYFNLEKESRELYESTDSFSKVKYGKTNISSVFIYLGLFKLLKPGGYFNFIVPKGLSYVRSWWKIRELILRDSKLLASYDVGKAFDGVGLEQIIVFAKNEESNNHLVKVQRKEEEPFLLPQLYLYEKNRILHSLTEERKSVIDYIEQDTFKLSEIATFPRGKAREKNIIFSNQETEMNTQYLGGINIEQFNTKNNNVRKPDYYINNSDLKKVTIHEDGYTNRKIIYQNLMSSKPRIVATIDQEERPNDDTVNNLLLNNESFTYEYIVAILNSHLATFYLKYMVINNAELTVHLDGQYVGQIPIKYPTEEENKKITELVNILLIDYSVETHKQLNSIIYSIYQLKENHIKLVMDCI